MNASWILYPFVPLCASALLVPAQDTQAPRKLTRLAPQEARQEPAAPAPAPARAQLPTPEEWRQKLADRDLDRRESAFEDLLANAREDGALRGALEQWAKAGDGSELAWTARLALRELRKPAPAPLRNRAGAFGRLQQPDARFDELRRRLEALEQDFGGMDSMFEDLRSQFGALPQVPGAKQESQGYSLQLGPDGVTLELREDANGSGETRTYKAKSMEELLQQNPELREKLGANGSFDLRGSPGQNWFFLRNGEPQSDWLRSTRPSLQPPTDVLGVYSTHLDPEQSKELGLEPKQGIRVDRVEPGTIAQILGIRRGDTLVEVNGKPVYEAADVRKALAERAAEEDVSVTLIGAGETQRRTLRWSPAAPEPAQAPARPLPAAPEKPRKL